MAYPFYLIDAFVTGHPFSGNPAAVVILEGLSEWPEEAWMQGVGMEFNQAETAFLLAESSGDYGLRWFTPKAEVDLCGHATMASTEALFAHGTLASSGVTFHTKSGPLVCTIDQSVIGMDFPAKPFEPGNAPTDAFEDAVYWGNNKMDWMVELGSEAAVKNYRPDFRMIEELGMRGLIITAKSETKDLDYVCRFFAPQVGVPEDHVTGSAHCCLAPYWGAKLGLKRLAGLQASPRGGVVVATLRQDRVLLEGKCRVFGSGRLA